jgi:hypothetical protein
MKQLFILVFCYFYSSSLFSQTGSVSIQGEFKPTGAISYPIFILTGSVTLNASHHTIVFTQAAAQPTTVTLPAAATCPGREYKFINHSGVPIFISIFFKISQTETSNQIPNSTVYQLISDGTNWRKSNSN